MIQKITDLKEPPVVGQLYVVPYIVVLVQKNQLEKGYDYLRVPVLYHLHNDKENGQHEPHYHIDSRFVPDEIPSNYPKRIYPHEVEEYSLNWKPFMCHRVREFRQTSTSLIKNSKLKHDCIYKGKCPHRGFDLSQVQPENGIITCPLHGLQFDAETGKLLNR